MDTVKTDWREETELIKKRCGFLFELHQAGVALLPKQIGILKKYRYLQGDGQVYRKKDERIDVTKIIRAQEKEKRLSETEIFTSDWMPKEDETGNYPADFVEWIDSINQGFKTRKTYKRFDLYCAQASNWLNENKHFSDFDGDAQWKFALQEFQRIKENSLYYLEKYVHFKTGSNGAGKYKAFDAHRIVAFLIDSGYCLLIGKARQIFFSTTIGAIAVKRLNFTKNYFVKFIAENLLKAEEIFEDKIKFPFYNLPNWMKSSVASDQEGMLRLMFKGYGGEKGNISGANSKLMVEAPYVTAINGGSPDLVLLDEIGQMDLVGDIIGEGRPTLFATDPLTGKMSRKRQVVGFGTGGEMTRGGAALQAVYDTCVDWWQKRNFTYGFIPLFFDFWARPGMTQKHFDDEKAIAYASGKEEERVRFHQHYPVTIMDMFLSSAETVISIGAINGALQRIYSKPKVGVKGHFEPIYDPLRKMPEGSFIPYAITGSTFVPSTLNDDAPITMIDEPDANWINRWYQGTDPINSQSGFSYLSSGMWDAHKNSVSCLLNARSKDYRNEYLQAYLMNIYFGRPPHLIEINVGREMANLIEMWGGMKSLLAQSMLPQSLQVNSAENIGIKKVSSNTPFIHNRLVEMLESYKDNIDVDVFFHQLKYFVKKEPTKASGKTDVSFRTADYRYHRDDAIYGVLYAYICAEAHRHREAREIGKKDVKRKVLRYITDPKNGYTTTLQEVWV
jgi:hypothetical protein